MKNRTRLFLCVLLLLALGSSLFGLGAAADYTYRMTVGEACDELIVFQFYRDITDADFHNATGQFAPGLDYEYDNIFIYVKGTPTHPGTYTIKGRALTEDGNGELYELTIIVESPNAGGNENGEMLPELPVEGEQPLLAPTLTKSPTDETVYQGSSAKFIARADNADKLDWYLIEPGSYNAYTLPQAASYLNGLSYSGMGTELLQLNNIPLEMDGWKVECLFTNRYGTVVSESATITVNELKLVNPSIKSQPQGAQKDMDSAVILNVIADNNTQGSSLKYQWYMSATNSGNLNPINGANSSSYTPPKTEGTVYYTVAVWSSIDGKDSGKTYSIPAAVTYSKAVAATPTPAPTASANPAPIVSPSPQASVRPDRESDSGGFGMLGVLIIVLLLSAALAVVILVILKKNANPDGKKENKVPFMEILMNEIRDYDDEVVEPVKPVQPVPQPVAKEWLCSCGALNNTPFCTQCGKARPTLHPCGNCGWTPESINKIPRFCPECGKPFENE